MSDSKHRIAIVGTGGIANSHAKAVTSLPDRAELVAAVDVDLDRAKEFATKWDIPAVYPSLTELLAAGGVDLVHLCTPPSSHVPLAAECLAADVDVLVEKPPTLSLDELDALLEAESASSAQVACVFQHRFGSGAVRLRELRGRRRSRPAIGCLVQHHLVPRRRVLRGAVAGHLRGRGRRPDDGARDPSVRPAAVDPRPVGEGDRARGPAGAADADRGRVDGTGHLRERRRRLGRQLPRVAAADVPAPLRLRERDGRAGTSLRLQEPRLDDHRGTWPGVGRPMPGRPISRMLRAGTLPNWPRSSTP